jgi:hypothetical protein
MDADLWQSRRLALHFQWVVVDAVGAQANIDWAASRSTPPATSFQEARGWNWTNGNKGEVLPPQRGSPTMVYSPKLIRTPVGLPKISLVKP